MVKILYSIAELAKKLGWSTEKTHVYYKRGKFEDPEYMTGNRPLWTEDQAEKEVRRINKARM